MVDVTGWRQSDGRGDHRPRGRGAAPDARERGRTAAGGGRCRAGEVAGSVAVDEVARRVEERGPSPQTGPAVRPRSASPPRTRISDLWNVRKIGK